MVYQDLSAVITKASALSDVFRNIANDASGQDIAAWLNGGGESALVAIVHDLQMLSDRADDDSGEWPATDMARNAHVVVHALTSRIRDANCYWAERSELMAHVVWFLAGVQREMATEQGGGDEFPNVRLNLNLNIQTTPDQLDAVLNVINERLSVTDDTLASLSGEVVEAD